MPDPDDRGFVRTAVIPGRPIMYVERLTKMIAADNCEGTAQGPSTNPSLITISAISAHRVIDQPMC